MNKKAPKPVRKALTKLYHAVSHPYSFIFILIVIIGWFIGGYFSHYSEEWYKNFHIFEIVVALIMVFLIENSTHADNKAMQEKLDEIIRKMPEADNSKVGLEKKYKGVTES